MASQKTHLLTLLLLLMSIVIVQSCNRKNDPCKSNRCCYLVFNLRGVLSYSFCRRKNRDDSKCAQNDYCLVDSDCDGGQKCEGASIIEWGRCKGTLRAIHVADCLPVTDGQQTSHNAYGPL